MVEKPAIVRNMDSATVSVTPVFDPVVTVYREQEAYPILSFVADIGGILGLFIGFNFLMVWDLIVWCSRKIYNNSLKK